MQAKILYFNWYKGATSNRMSVTLSGEIATDRPDLYDCVGEVDVDPTIAACEKVFRDYNRVEEGDMDGMEIRSMSVGDIVLFHDGTAIAVAGCGWNEQKLLGHNRLGLWSRETVKRQDR